MAYSEKPGNIFIVGGGPVGATLALVLQQQGVAATILEARNQGAAHHDQRALALSYGSRMILERLGIWEPLASQATAINTIHVSQRGSLGRSRLRASDYGQPALGYVLSYGALSKTLDGALARSPDIQVVHDAEVTGIETTDAEAAITYTETVEEGIREIRHASAALAVLADGGNSLAHIPGLQRKSRDYGHSALVARVCSELPHANIAYERFTPAGPVALLPNGEEFSLVWTGKDEEIKALLQTSDGEFLDKLHRHFGDRVGEFLKVGSRLSFPLRLAYLDTPAMPHLAVIGNAAQTMHPVAGQGFNIGLRDAWELATSIAETDPADWGSNAMLLAYRKTRRSDTRGGLLFTDFLVNVFSNELIGLSSMRSAGLGMLDIIQPLKRRLVGKMSFGR
jgi:2-octaprenyl-6-methoxyphenol hydroxylase